MDKANIKTVLSDLKHEMNQLLESEQVNSSEVYQLSVRLDKIIIDYYKSKCKL